MAVPKKKKPLRKGAPAGPSPEDIGDPTMMGGGDPMMVSGGASPPMEMMPPGLEAVAGTGMGAPMMDGGPMMAPSAPLGGGAPMFPSTDPGMMLAAMSRLMDEDHQNLAMAQMQALQAIGPLAAQAIARASGMAESVDGPGGPAGMSY